MKDRTWYPVAFMFVVTAVFSGILIGLAALTRERVEANQQIFRERAVLVALGRAQDDTPAPKVHELYTEWIQPVRIDPDRPDDLENVREYRLENTSDVAVPIYGRGYWDRIRGVVGLRGDPPKVIGIAIYEQKETPGLGAEIVTAKWRNQFAGKVLAAGDTPIDIRPPEATLDESSVHAVTGATQTSTRLERFMNNQLAAWRDSRSEGGSP